jgi:hypothetical protein
MMEDRIREKSDEKDMKAHMRRMAEDEIIA